MVHCSHLVPPGRSNNCNNTTASTQWHTVAQATTAPTSSLILLLLLVITLRFLIVAYSPAINSCINTFGFAFS